MKSAFVSQIRKTNEIFCLHYLSPIRSVSMQTNTLQSHKLKWRLARGTQIRGGREREKKKSNMPSAKTNRQQNTAFSGVDTAPPCCVIVYVSLEW